MSSINFLSWKRFRWNAHPTWISSEFHRENGRATQTRDSRLSWFLSALVYKSLLAATSWWVVDPYCASDMRSRPAVFNERHERFLLLFNFCLINPTWWLVRCQWFDVVAWHGPHGHSRMGRALVALLIRLGGTPKIFKYDPLYLYDWLHWLTVGLDYSSRF
jgi:hypothetical protein